MLPGLALALALAGAAAAQEAMPGEAVALSEITAKSLQHGILVFGSLTARFTILFVASAPSTTSSAPTRAMS